MVRIKATIEYIGTNYCGFQIQPNGKTVQYELQVALSKLLNENIVLVASGRTDAGVHATGQTIHFDTDSNIDVNCIPMAVSALLPKDIAILSCEYVDEKFHARYSCVNKTYCYRLVQTRINLPLYYGRAYQCKFKLDVNEIKAAMRYIIGEQDYRCFMASGSAVVDTVRNITQFEVSADGDEIVFEISANGFLYNMVRIIIGTLIEVGRGKLLAEEIPTIIASKDRRSAGGTAPAEGLYLVKTVY